MPKKIQSVSYQIKNSGLAHRKNVANSELLLDVLVYGFKVSNKLEYFGVTAEF